MYPMDAVFDTPADVPEEVGRGSIKGRARSDEVGRGSIKGSTASVHHTVLMN